jgi:hypothetical protein
MGLIERFMKTESLAVIITLAFYATETSSQTKFHLELGGGFVSNTLSTGVLSNWEGGWSINVAALYDLTACLQLTAKAGYQQHEYAGGSLQLVNFRSLNFRREIDGDDTDVYELSFGARFVDKTKVKLFFAARGGLSWIDVGRIRITQSSYAPDILSTSDYPGSGESLQKGFALFGAGFIVPITNGLNLVLESDLLSTFDREEVVIPLNASLQIGL